MNYGASSHGVYKIRLTDTWNEMYGFDDIEFHGVNR